MDHMALMKNMKSIMTMDIEDVAHARLMTKDDVTTFRRLSKTAAEEILHIGIMWWTSSAGPINGTQTCVYDSGVWESVGLNSKKPGIRPVIELTFGPLKNEIPGETAISFKGLTWTCVGSGLYLCEKALWTGPYKNDAYIQRKLDKWLMDPNTLGRSPIITMWREKGQG